MHTARHRAVGPGIIVSVFASLPTAGRSLVWASWAGTVAFVVAISLAVASADLRPVGVTVSLVLFGIGCVTFLWAYAIAIDRSRIDAIGIGGLYFLAGSAPASVRRHMMSALAIQTVVSIVAASMRPFTPVAFGILVPMYGLGLAGLWAARHGIFERRTKVVPKKKKPTQAKP